MTEKEQEEALLRAQATTRDAAAFRISNLRARREHLLRERPLCGENAARWIDRELRAIAEEQRTLEE
jgi:hypothetical protein